MNDGIVVGERANEFNHAGEARMRGNGSAPVTPTTPAAAAGRGVARDDSAPHILTVALEDYYQNFKDVIRRTHWERFETRVENSTLRTLDLLDEFGIRATFFAVGWIAAHVPEIIREVARRGHEVASKGYSQRSVGEMSPAEFREDLARARDALESASGQPVVGYRAPGWLRPADLWALEVLSQERYLYDSSIKPIFYRPSLLSAGRFAHWKHFGDQTLWEFPISTVGRGSALIPVGAGNYFRQLPTGLIDRAVAHWERTYPGAPFVMYFHTWELDPEQPQITAAPLLNRIRKYRNLDKVPQILRRYFQGRQFACIADYLGLLEAPDDAGAFALTPVHAADSSGGRVWRGSAVRERHAGTVAAQAEPTTRERITLVVPCFNEQHSLPYLANTLRSVEEALSERYELKTIFVDDCSVDTSWQLLQKLFPDESRYTRLRHTRNRGVAGCITTGLRAAQTEIVCSIDCDCSYDPHNLVQMIPLLEDGVAMVTASPYHPDGHVYNVPRWRLSLSKTLSRMYRRVLHQRLHTYTSCFRVYRRSAVLGVEPERNGFLGVAELLGRLALSGATIVEYPATLEVRMLGYSKMRVLRTIIGHLGLISRLTAERFGVRRPALARPSGSAAEGLAAAPDGEKINA